MKKKTGPALGVMFLGFVGLGMICYGLLQFLQNESWIWQIGFGFLNLVLAFYFSNHSFGRKSTGTHMPMMRERLYGPSGDKKPIIHQKLPLI